MYSGAECTGRTLLGRPNSVLPADFSTMHLLGYPLPVGSANCFIQCARLLGAHQTRDVVMSLTANVRACERFFGLLALKMLGPYAQSKIVEQIKTVFLIVAYLVLFQLMSSSIFQFPMPWSWLLGIELVALCWAWPSLWKALFFGLMPLGEIAWYLARRKPQCSLLF